MQSTQVASHWRGPLLLNYNVLAVADGLFGLYGSDCRGGLFVRYPTVSPPSPAPYKLYVAAVDAKHHRSFRITCDMSAVRLLESRE